MPDAIRKAARENRLLLAIVIGTVLIRLAALLMVGPSDCWRDLLHDLLPARTLRYLVPFALIPLPLAFLLYRLEARDDSDHWLPGLAGWRLAVARFREKIVNAATISSSIIAVLCIALIVNVYGSWKRVMPSVAPFSWDARINAADRVLHFGHEPWRVMQPFAGNPQVTLLLDYLYNTWLPFIFLSIGWLIWTRHRNLRKRGLLGIAFAWLFLGNLVATLFSSAGPAFYGRLVPGPDPFAPLLSYLDGVAQGYHLFARKTQEALWWLHIHERTDLYTGISAMPSVHLAMPALFTCIGWERNRVLGIAFGLYTLLILLATVHLGWHYAVDGYVSICAVWLFWRLLRKHCPPASVGSRSTPPYPQVLGTIRSAQQP